ncbi:hypothetical protein AB0J21_25485 [Streptomyces sp. NPDC049954]|uniref:hypothetical protein n=1 Tax=Streptomyces sp. NPDC049954 TaxID=3155779 RepID=UPI0034348E1F
MDPNNPYDGEPQGQDGEHRPPVAGERPGDLSRAPEPAPADALPPQDAPAPFDAFGVLGGAGAPSSPPAPSAPAGQDVFGVPLAGAAEETDEAQAARRRPRPARDPLGPDFGPSSGGLARTARIVSDDLLITVNPVDGSEVEPCPPGALPGRPARRGPAVRAERRRAARPPVPAGPAHNGGGGLLERAETKERLTRLLARGRSVRLTGPGGCGRTALLDVVAGACESLAPDGVVRLGGRGRTPDDLLHELFGEVYEAPLHRPGRELLLDLLREVGAVVIIDDLEFGGAALDELLDATPECAFLVAATPDIPAPSADAHFEEVFLSGIGRGSGLELLERAVDRPLTDEEANWAGDLWFESEGLPLRFVQAGALLLQRDRLRADPSAFEEFGYFSQSAVDTAFDTNDGEVLLPSLAEGAAPAAALASRLSPSARDALRYAVALGGELPHPAHLPALTGDTHADAALAELADTVLVTPAGAGYRLATGVLVQLEAAGYAEGAAERADVAARHYAWWAAHPSVSPERVAAEAECVLAALAAVVAQPTAPPQDGEEAEEGSAGVLLARAAAPAFAAALHWGAWERALRGGQEAARGAGQVADEAYFHHELGVLALCENALDRARAELEASIALRGALADRRGTVAGRRALALVTDRSGGTPPPGVGAVTEELPSVRPEEPSTPPGGLPPALVAQLPGRAEPQPPFPPLLSTGAGQPVSVGRPEPAAGRRAVFTGTRRNLVAAGAGALLVAVLGTVVTLGATSDKDEAPADRVTSEQSASTDDGEDGQSADRPDDGATDSTRRPEADASATDPGEDGVLGTADDPTPSAQDGDTPSAGDSAGPSTSGGPDESGDESGDGDQPGTSQKPSTSHKPGKPSTGKPTGSGKPSTSTPPPTTADPTDDPGTQEPPTDPGEPPTTEAPPTGPDEPETSDSASGPVPSTPAGETASQTASTSAGPTGSGDSGVI